MNVLLLTTDQQRADTMAAFHDVEIWNKRRNADLQAELPKPARRSRQASTPLERRRGLKGVR